MLSSRCSKSSWAKHYWSLLCSAPSTRISSFRHFTITFTKSHLQCVYLKMRFVNFIIKRLMYCISILYPRLTHLIATFWLDRYVTWSKNYGDDVLLSKTRVSTGENKNKFRNQSFFDEHCFAMYRLLLWQIRPSVRLSICLSVCMSRACVLQKQLKLQKRSYGLVGKPHSPSFQKGNFCGYRSPPPPTFGGVNFDYLQSHSVESATPLWYICSDPA